MAAPKQTKGKTTYSRVPVPTPASKPPPKTTMGGSRTFNPPTSPRIPG